MSIASAKNYLVFLSTLFASLFFALSVFAANPGSILSGFNESRVMRDSTSINFGLFTTASVYNVQVYDTYLKGYAWGEKVGWISLNCANEVVNNCGSNGNFHVANNTSGQLSGWAWGQKTGWINFGPFSNSATASVVINPSTGEFNGYAWAQKLGWIEFLCPGVSCVKTDWVPVSVTPTPTPPPGSVAILGCTDPLATNYNPGAMLNNGSCTYPPMNPTTVLGCTNPTATNYNSLATVDDGSCAFVSPTYGCINPSATNYNPSATVSNGSCIFPHTAGCTNPLATNYNPSATTSNNSCTFPPQPPTCATNPSLCTPPPAPTCASSPSLCIPPQTQLSTIPSTSSSTSCLSNILSCFTSLIPQNLFSVPLSLFKLLAKIFGGLGLLAALSSIPYPFFRSVFAFFYKKRRPWGTVYDSVTKQPLDPAYVVFQDATNTEVETAITDMDGRYGFLERQGTYKIIANKTNYTFPSIRLAGKDHDELYDDLYFGEPFTIDNANDLVVKNIPLDPIGFDWNEYEKRKMHLTKYYARRDLWLARLSTVIFWIGFLFSIGAVLLSQTIWNMAIVGVYGIFFLLRNTVFKQKGFGVVYDAFSNSPISFALIKIYRSGLNQMVGKTTTDPRGRYYKLLANAVYYFTVEVKQPDGTYKLVHTSEPIDLKHGIINKNITVSS